MISSLQKQFEALDVLRASLNKDFPLKKWDDSTKEEFINDCTYHSNKIEGLKYNYGETINLLKKGIIKSHGSAKDISDLINHRDLLLTIFDSYEKPLSIDLIKSLHKELMKDPIQHDSISDIDFKPGEFKKGYNFGTRRKGEFKEYAPPWEVENQLTKLVTDTNQKLNQVNGSELILNEIAKFHYTFLNEIHPFTDGNGRIARLVMNIQLMQKGFSPIIIDSEQKDRYIQALIDSEKEESRTPILKVLVDALALQMEMRWKKMKSK